jgi:hypothetical protein
MLGLIFFLNWLATYISKVGAGAALNFCLEPQPHKKFYAVPQQRLKGSEVWFS